jgi:hypothetical protein
MKVQNTRSPFDGDWVYWATRLGRDPAKPPTTYACFTDGVTMSFTVHGADDNSPYSEEPDEARVSRPVREWRRGG